MLDINKIQKVYNGRFGCMCGCRGKYSYATDQSQSPYDIENDRIVKIIAGKVLRNPNRKVDGDHVYVEDRARNKLQVVFFKEPVGPFETISH